ncbi:hypothetical protein NQ318_006249 [Aromia moschata]|uniref:Mucolipin extracytosolic domain-containing protein n=1 Tax=Aromia moschata TaxID=1265417 RepID=A0AAV8YWR7_9CUCU|nr:hypothetical protein NQ318_006249 [Aromia moschata]
MEETSPECESVENCDERCGIAHQRCCQNSTKRLLTEEKMRRKLQFFFMNPIEKWQAKKRFPYKFCVQVIKIILVTMQLCLFAYRWDTTMEINAYPPGAGPLAIYQMKEFYSTLDYAYEGYANLNKAIGSYSYANEDNTMTDMVLCLYQYKKGIIFGFNESYVFNNEIIETCLNITQKPETGLLNSKEYVV